MTCYLGKKWLHIILLAYLVLAVPGSLVFSVGESFCVDNLDTDSLGADVFFSSISHTVDWLAEDTTIGKAQYSSSRLRYGLLRELDFVGICITALYFARSYLQLIKNDNVFTARNHIPLILRL